MSDREHQELKSLLGAFALNATSPLEHRRVGKHIETCAECAHEVRMLGEVAAELSWLPGPEESGDLVDEIISGLAPRPRRAWTRALGAVAAVSVVVAGFLSVALVRERARNDDVSAVLATARSTVRFAAQGAFEGAGTLYVSDGGAVAILEGLPSAGSDRAYQLWAISDSKPSSVGVIDGDGRVVRMFDWTGAAESYAVTIEPAGGSPVPTSDPVLIGT